MPRNVRIIIATLFSVLIFLSKFFLPTPVDKILIIIEVILLSLSSLILGGFGASYTGLISGVLLTFWRTPFAPFSLIFATSYGLTIDIFFRVLNVKVNSNVMTGRVIIAVTLSTMLTGILSMSVTFLLGLMPLILSLYLMIIVIGTLNGALSGYLTSLSLEQISDPTLITFKLPDRFRRDVIMLLSTL